MARIKNLLLPQADLFCDVKTVHLRLLGPLRLSGIDYRLFATTWPPWLGGLAPCAEGVCSSAVNLIVTILTKKNPLP